MPARLGEKAPNLFVSQWIQGRPTNIDKEKGNVVLVEVFQVNCPGCFIYGIPAAIEMHKKYYHEGLRVLGLATAFEDYDKNTVDNLKLLLTTGEVIGETKKLLTEYGQLQPGNKLPYNIPFAVGMDTLLKFGSLTDDKIMDFIEANVSDFKAYSEKDRQSTYERVKQYLKLRQFSAKTFDEYGLRGTPSAILIDKNGILQHSTFGSDRSLEGAIKYLLDQ
ncbi:MAG: TlpA family protein disulfide reductase [Nitrososphaeraceae archaeon]|nr:TlpA family protein disulfide reductase [Nitrososphaeraceae archaeon]